jgi:hypothetical protein
MKHNFYINLNENELGELAQLDGEAIAAYLFVKRNACFETALTRVISYGAFAAYRGYGENAREKARRQIAKLVKYGLLDATERQQVFQLPFATIRAPWQETPESCDRNNSNSTQNTTKTTHSGNRSHFLKEEKVKTQIKPYRIDLNPPSEEVLTLMNDLKDRLISRGWIYAANEIEENVGYYRSAAEWFLKRLKSSTDIEIIIEEVESGCVPKKPRVLDLCLLQNKWRESKSPF